MNLPAREDKFDEYAISQQRKINCLRNNQHLGRTSEHCEDVLKVHRDKNRLVQSVDAQNFAKLKNHSIVTADAIATEDSAQSQSYDSSVIKTKRASPERYHITNPMMINENYKSPRSRSTNRNLFISTMTRAHDSQMSPLFSSFIHSKHQNDDKDWVDTVPLNEHPTVMFPKNVQ